jgi:serine protease
MTRHTRREHSSSRFCVALAAFCLSLSAQAGGPPTKVAAAAAAAGPDTTDQLIIKFRKDTPAARTLSRAAMPSAYAAANALGVQMKALRRNALGAAVMKLDRRLSMAEAQALAKAVKQADPLVQYAEPDRIMHIQFSPNDTSYASQWHYYEPTGGLNLPAAWDKSTGSGVVVAVIDTGFRPHADLAANLLTGYDMISDATTGNDGDGRDGDASDPGDWTTGQCGPARNSSWHGTHVAGTIAAVTNNGSGVAGVAFNAKVVPVRALGTCGGYTSDIADGIVWASGGTVSGAPFNANPARVINMSLGGSGACDFTTQSAIDGARSRGTVIVVAAGNSNTDASGFNPANCAGVVSVASVDRNGSKAYYSNFGASVDVAAPGGDVTTGDGSNGVLSTLNSGTTTPGSDIYAYYQGTSMASPHVAGVAALMLAANGALTADDVEAQLKSTARGFPGTCSSCGTGIVDANAAVDAAIGGGGGGGGGNTVAEVENNDALSSAQFISVNPATVNGSISSGSDTDFYAVTLRGAATLIATLTPPSTADYDLYVYDSAGNEIGSSINGTGAVDSVMLMNPSFADDTRYVRVVYYGGAAGSYTLGLSQ